VVGLQRAPLPSRGRSTQPGRRRLEPAEDEVEIDQQLVRTKGIGHRASLARQLPTRNAGAAAASPVTIRPSQ
jgi:hypothetical protein